MKGGMKKVQQVRTRMQLFLIDDPEQASKHVLNYSGVLNRTTKNAYCPLKVYGFVNSVTAV